jgi:glycosyltransferase involved in cell wall biosynthesis
VNWPSQCAVVIPCFNEGKAIRPLVEAVRKHLPNILVIDDGSSDATAANAKAAGAEVLRHESNLGKGAALMRGWRRAYETGCIWALAMDGDGQHSPEDIPKFLRAAETTSAQLVVGNRMENPAAMPFVRRAVNRWMSATISRRAGCNLPDTQSGFRLMNLSAWAALPLETQRFEIESEVLLAFVRAGSRVNFVPIQVIYRDEQSKIHPVADTIRWFRWWRGWCGVQKISATGTPSKVSEIERHAKLAQQK